MSERLKWNQGTLPIHFDCKLSLSILFDSRVLEHQLYQPQSSPIGQLAQFSIQSHTINGSVSNMYQSIKHWLEREKSLSSIRWKEREKVQVLNDISPKAEASPKVSNKIAFISEMVILYCTFATC